MGSSLGGKSVFGPKSSGKVNLGETNWKQLREQFWGGKVSKIEIKKQALLVQQRPPLYSDVDEFLKEYDFFLFSMNSTELAKIAKFTSRSESKFGVQRSHVEERDKQIGQFITSEHPFFPNTIIINLPLVFKKDFFDFEHNILELAVEPHSSYVIDGQHRLKAFMSRYSNNTSLELVVVAYFGLELPTIAEIFTRINFYQKPVSKSLVYDLLDLNRDPEFDKYKEGHDIISNLNAKVGSPFYNIIKMLGVGPGQLSQAAAVEALTTRYKILSMMEHKYNTDDKSKVIEKYFDAIRLAFKERWSSPNSILTKSVGFNALVKVLRTILSSRIVEADLTSIDFKEIATVMSNVDIDAAEVKSFGGFKGVSAIAQRFEAALKDGGLL